MRAGTAPKRATPSLVITTFAGGGLIVLGFCVCCATAASQPPTWKPVGPRPTTGGQVENITDGEVVGAVKAVAPHPTDANIAFIGSVNGGIWMSTNATAASPSWQCQTDGQKSLSIGALEFDPTDASHQTLVAGIGIFSSLAEGGALTGLLRTASAGASWTAIDGGGALVGLNVSGVAPRGATIVLSANAANVLAKRGIWRINGAGAVWSQVSGAAGSGLPAGPSFDLASDPTNPNRLYTNGGGSGLYRSDDAGATWVKKSNVAMDGVISGASNIKITVGTSNNVYVAIVSGVSGQLDGVLSSHNNGDVWNAMDLPMIAEGGINPGGQGQIHLSIAADRTNPQIVYIGGDRQEGNFPNDPNSIGARDYSGVLFRGDASKASASQWVHLTHSSTLGPAGGGTAHSSSPHADSRDLAVDANGELLLGCDGGVYRRTSPKDNTGDWKSMNGNLQTTEFHAVAYDSNSGTVVGGAQDTGTPEENVNGGPKWHSVSTGDGGVVAVDARSLPGQSIRYTSYFSLGTFRRQVYDSHNNLVSEVLPSLAVIGGGNDLVPQFYTPIRLNSVDPSRLIIGAANSVYESSDKGDTISEIGPGIATNGTGPNPIAYGAGVNSDALYVGARNQVFVRLAPGPAVLTASAGYSGDFVVGIAVDPNDPLAVHVVDPSKVYRSSNAGATWTDVTGNLAGLSPGKLRSIAYGTSIPAGALVVGTDIGVFVAFGPTFNNWAPLGAGLPPAPVFHIEYDTKDNVFLAGTLGRGAWMLSR